MKRNRAGRPPGVTPRATSRRAPPTLRGCARGLAPATAVALCLAACFPPAAPPPAVAAPGTASATATAAAPAMPPAAAPSPAARSDTDGDGIDDGEDACPFERTGPHPSPTEPGCPTHVRLTPGRIMLLSSIEFEFDKATLRPSSLPIVDELVFVLSSHPEIARVEIQVHGPSDPYRAVHITERRARALLKALVAKGVEASRIVAKGYGPERPIASADTEEGRRLNRRVELWILPPPAPGR